MRSRSINATDGPAASGGYSQAFEVEGAKRILYVSGQIPVDADGRVPEEFETQARLARAVKRLSPTQREVFSLRIAEGLSYREIAEAVGTTEGAARVHYHNAMRAVKEFLDE